MYPELGDSIRCEKGDATLAFLKGSHRYHRDFAEEFQIDSKSDWFLLNEEQISFYEN